MIFIDANEFLFPLILAFGVGVETFMVVFFSALKENNMIALVVYSHSCQYRLLIPLSWFWRSCSAL